MSTTAGRWMKLYGSLIDGDALRMSRDARLLGVEAEAWADDNETDGLIPRNALRRITDADDVDALVSELVAAGRWAETDDGWEILGFLDRHDDADRRANDRARHAERQRNFGRHTRGDHGDWCPSTCRFRGQNDGVNAAVIDKVQRDAKQREASRSGQARSASPSRSASGSAPLARKSRPRSAESVAKGRATREANARRAAEEAAERQRAHDEYAAAEQKRRDDEWLALGGSPDELPIAQSQLNRRKYPGRKEVR